MKTISFILFALINISIYSQGWVLQTTGTSNDLNDVYMLDALTGYTCGQTGTVLKTTNGGVNWVSQTTGTSSDLNSICFINASTGFSSGNTGTIIKTTNGGSSWVIQTSGTSQHLFGLFTADALTVYISKNFSTSSSILRTVNGGTNWTSVYTGFASSTTDIFFVNSLTGYLTGLDFGLVKTTNAGTNWIEMSVPDFMKSVYFPSTTTGYVVGTSSGSRTTNSGDNWISMTFPSGGTYRSVFFTSETTGYIAGQLGAGSSPLLMKTTNAGVNWVEQPTGQAQYLNSVYFPNTSTGFACGRVGLMIKTTTGGTTGIHTVNETATEYSLAQNYPNPFNPETRIKFSIPQKSVVKIFVYDLRGAVTAILVNSELSSGTYEINFSGLNIASGVYFYKLVTPGYILTRKMLLLK